MLMMMNEESGEVGGCYSIYALREVLVRDEDRVRLEEFFLASGRSIGKTKDE
jgi:hypothetical protein